MVTDIEERQILQDVAHGLSAALHEQDRDPENMGRFALHKLVCLAAQYFDSPIEFKYHQYGPVLNSTAFEENSLQPKPLADIQHPTESSVKSEQYPAPVDYASFFIKNYYTQESAKNTSLKTDPAVRLYEKANSPYGPFEKNVNLTQSLAFRAILASVMDSEEISSDLSEEHKKGVRLAIAISIGFAVGIPISTLSNAITGLGVGLTTTGVVSHELSDFYSIKKRQ